MNFIRSLSSKKHHSSPDELYEIMIRLLITNSWDEKKRIVEQHPELLSDEAESLLEKIIAGAYASGEDQFAAVANDHRVVLQSCRRIGIEATFTGRKWIEKMLDPIWAFIEASTSSEKRRVLEQHPELLDEGIDGMMMISVNQLLAVGRVEDAHVVEENRGLLTRCREVGVEKAFTELLHPLKPEVMPTESVQNDSITIPDKFKHLVNKVFSLSRPSEMPLRVVLCRQVLGAIQRETNPAFWAVMQDELAVSLYKNPQGERAENIEQAIRHCQLALEEGWTR